jgi:hypothetical protein
MKIEASGISMEYGLGSSVILLISSRQYILNIGSNGERLT